MTDTTLIQQLAAFIPQDFRHALVQGQDLPPKATGSVLFADISGFTILTRKMSQQLGRKQGAEAVLAQINPVYEALIAELHNYGGSVINFVGDAINCWLDDSQGASAPRAVAAALAMQQVMAQFTAVSIPNGKTIPLRIKISIATGPVYRVLVGDPAIRKLKALAGETVHRAAEAGEFTQAGEIVVSKEVVEELGAALQVAEWRNGRFALITSLNSKPLITPWPELPVDSFSIEQVQSWLLPEVFSHLQSGGEYLGDLRPVTPMMLRFPEPDFDHDPQAAKKLDAYIRWVQHVIHNHGGNLIQLTIGDKGAFLYAPFGAPAAHEDDLRRASLAALTLHHPPPEIAPVGGVQIGLSRGEVWTGNCGASVRHTYGVMGDDVNLAARLMVTAVPGQTIVSATMVDNERFFYRKVGKTNYKGFTQPVTTYELLDEKEQVEKLFKGKMVGREEDIRQIETAVQPIFQGKFAGVISVLGDAGIGKSHLTYELYRKLGNRVIWLECSADGVRRESLNPFKQIIYTTCHQSIDLPPAENRRRFEEVMSQMTPVLPPNHPQSEMIRQELERTKSILAAFVDLHWSDSLYEQLAPNLRFENMLYAFKNFVHALALIKPVILHLDDAHWLDEDSPKLLQTLTRNADDIPLSLVFCARHEGVDIPTAVALPEYVPQTTLVLAELAEPGISALLTQVLGHTVTEEATTFLMEKTGGNPFFVQQLALDLQERELLVLNSKNNTYELQQVNAGEMPTTLNTVLISRLDRLGTAVKEVVQTAAVLGREFEVQLLSHMLTNQTENISKRIKMAEQAQIWSALTELRYLFRHALMRDAAYGMQLAPRLKNLHRAAAETITKMYADDLVPHTAALAYHFDQAGQIEDACHFYQEEAQQAAAQYANQEAIRAYSRALELTANEKQSARFQLIEARSELYRLTGQRHEQKADVDQLLIIAKELTDQRLMAEAHYKRGIYFARGNETEETIAELEETLALNTTLQDKELEIRVYTLWAQTLWQSGQYDAAREKLNIAQPLAQQDHQALEAEVLSSLSIVCGISGDVAGAIEAGEKAVTLHQQVGNRRSEALALNSLGIQARRQGRYSEAEGYYQTSFQILQELGFRLGLSVLSNNLALVWLEQGRYEKAKQRLKFSIEISRNIGIGRNEAWSLAHLALVELRSGNLDAAKLAASEAMAKAKAFKDPDVEGYATLYQGHVLSAVGEGNAATAVYRESIAIRQKLEQTNLSMEPMAGMVAVAVAEGKPTQAQTEADAILAQLDTDPELSGTNEPFRVHWVAYNYLRTLNDARADFVLKRAISLLQARSEKISNPTMRQSFLENVTVHQQIMEKKGNENKP